ASPSRASSGPSRRNSMATDATLTPGDALRGGLVGRLGVVDERPAAARPVRGGGGLLRRQLHVPAAARGPEVQVGEARYLVRADAHAEVRRVHRAAATAVADLMDDPEDEAPVAALLGVDALAAAQELVRRRLGRFERRIGVRTEAAQHQPERERQREER